MILRYLEEGKIFAFQSWYFAYVLAIAMVVICGFFAVISKKKIMRILFCLPTVIMVILCLIIRGIDADFAEYIGNADYFFDIANTLDSRLYVFYTIKKAVTERWLAASWSYIVFSAVLSLAALLIVCRTTKKSVLNTAGCVAAMFACLLLLFVIDRNTALSAKMLFSPSEAELPEKQTFINTDMDGNEIWQRSHSSGVDTQFERTTYYEVADEIPVYIEPTRSAEIVETVDAGCSISGVSMTSFRVSERASWRYADRVAVKSGLGYKRLTGYVKVEDIVNACVGMHNRYPRFIVRQKLMEVDTVSYSMGYAVSPSVMYAFEPFEIYLLAPLTTIFGITWLVLLMRSHIAKRKASTA